MVRRGLRCWPEGWRAPLQPGAFLLQLPRKPQHVLIAVSATDQLHTDWEAIFADASGHRRSGLAGDVENRRESAAVGCFREHLGGL